MIRKFSILCLALSAVFVACKKSDTTPNPNASGTAAADSVAILGKWTLTGEWGAIYDNGNFIDSGHTDVTVDDYMIFDNNGKFYNHEKDANNNFQDETDTAYYRVIDGHHFVGNGYGPTAPMTDTADIVILNANNLKI